MIRRERIRDNMTDYIVRGMAANNQIRAFAATTRGVVEEARKRHQTSPVATAALGRLLTAGAIMGSMMKGEKDLLTLQIKCGGPIGGLTVTADSKANVKGYAHHPQVMLPPNQKGKLDVGGALGLGVLSVIKDLGMKEPYIGQTHLVSGEIAEDLTYYFATSEQTPSTVALGVLMEKDNTVKQAGGFLIQLMPHTEEWVIDELEQKIKELDSITSLLDRGMTAESVLEHVLGGFGLDLVERTPTRFSCNCSKDKVEKALISVGREELDNMYEEGKPVEMHCHFCNTNYTFGIDEIEKIRKHLQKPKKRAD